LAARRLRPVDARGGAADLARLAGRRGARTDAAAAAPAGGTRAGVAAGAALVPGRMLARAGAVALVECAHVAVVGARRPARIEAVVSRLVAEIRALRAARARIARVRAHAAAADVGAVAEEPVVARRGVVRVDARPRAVAVIVGADVRVGRA